jgi:Flp pilus assembly protein TadD
LQLDPSAWRRRAAIVLVSALLATAYGNHFRNGFHFDDGHAIVDNVYVRDLKFIPRYFVDATTFSVLPLNQSYRPVLQTTFAIDYWIGGYNAFVFQVDTFVWYLLLLVSMAAFFRTLTRDRWVTLVAVAIFALHPVSAETVNYIVQRGDLLSTLGLVTALAIYARWPSQRRRGWYLAPFVCAALVKPPALVFPALLAAYVRMFEPRERVLRAIAPSVGVMLALGWWLSRNTPLTATTGASNAAAYLWTQPYVALRYFSMFFAPLGLSADNDWPLLGPSDPRVVAGLLFVVAVIAASWKCSQHEATRPVAFGLLWFMVALVPTSVTPLAEVANDHRMFFPFVGLSLAVTQAAALLTRAVVPAGRGAAVATIVIAVLLAETAGVHARNEVWRSDESLWRDVTRKSPGNGRGWMNYGLTLMRRGDYNGSIAAFERALPLTPSYHLLYINLGIALGQAGRGPAAEDQFLRAVSLAPADWRSHLWYARWLAKVGRGPDALAHARLARELNPADVEAVPVEQSVIGFAGTPEYFLARSLAEYQMRRFRECIESARQALALRPSYAEAMNNIAAAHNALGEWDAGIAAGEEALRLNPSLQIAVNNVNYAREQKRQHAR